MIVALVDSGAGAAHPHLQGARISGFSVLGAAPPFSVGDDFSDLTGHGTAAAAALFRLQPNAELLILRVLDDELRCSSAALAFAVEQAAERGARVINLSLGSRLAESAELLSTAVARATELGAVCVAAAHPRGRGLYPADLPTVLSALAHPSCPLSDIYRVAGPLPRFLAHGYPRPIEGRPPTDNFYGPSFAAVHLSAAVCAVLETQPGLSFEGLVAALRTQAAGEVQGLDGPLSPAP